MNVLCCLDDSILKKTVLLSSFRSLVNFVLINWGPSLYKPYLYYIITQTKIALIYYCEFSANRLQIEFLYLLIRVNQCHSIHIISVFFLH